MELNDTPLTQDEFVKAGVESELASGLAVCSASDQLVFFALWNQPGVSQSQAYLAMARSRDESNRSS